MNTLGDFQPGYRPYYHIQLTKLHVLKNNRVSFSHCMAIIDEGKIFDFVEFALHMDPCPEESRRTADLR